MDAVIFDADGTIWDSAGPITASWNIALEKHCPYPLHLETSTIRSMLGRPMTDFYALFREEMSLEEKQALLDACTEEEERYIRQHHPDFFPGVLEMFRDLSKKVSLYILSNCQCGYIDLVIEAGHLQPYVSGQLCFGDTGLPKSGTIRRLMELENLKDVAYVGDTAGDAAACREAGVPFIWAAYGYGREVEAPYRINAMDQLEGLLQASFGVH